MVFWYENHVPLWSILLANKNSNSTHDMTLSYKNYKRGFFSSSSQIALTFNNGITESEIKSGQSIVLNINVDHGPFPLSQLSKGNIKPTIATAKVSLAKNEVTQSYYTATKGKTPFAADIVVAFGGGGEYNTSKISGYLL
ncbi:DUF945 family protein [Escherichia albertii]